MEAQEDDESLSYILFRIIRSHNKNVINGKKAINVKCNCRNKSIHLSSSELWPLMSYTYLNKYDRFSACDRLVDIIH